MSNTAEAESSGVRLKRKVRNAETNLFEWRPCSCTIVARAGKLLLQLQTPPQDEDGQDEHDGETEIVTIDLVTQLLNVVAKKNKTRCDLEYYAPVATMSGNILKEDGLHKFDEYSSRHTSNEDRLQAAQHDQELHLLHHCLHLFLAMRNLLVYRLHPLGDEEAEIKFPVPNIHLLPKATCPIFHIVERNTGFSGVKLTSSALPSRGPHLYRASTRTRQSPTWFSDLPRGDDKPTGYDGESESSQAELHILQRVEAALRALELENSQAKARERELVQEIQTLRDAARVAAAERKHIEHEYRHARRDVDSWRRAAQSAEAAAAQLQEQLGIAREENQLLAGEKLRLKRQNSELLAQVHRLDSLVYGRF
ncbi:hypothetical protein PHPALM_1753 [Phytophthora palmivora]|uniref:Uncharacterized protein n=1 Tax=Phytophthora palmivora TaxID=4796 RepID=A0A2P4YRG2_9STRA|nr:hypothetical protein PHPALM_1753 [Phytophthora palmivora]